MEEDLGQTLAALEDGPPRPRARRRKQKRKKARSCSEDDLDVIPLDDVGALHGGAGSSDSSGHHLSASSDTPAPRSPILAGRGPASEADPSLFIDDPTPEAQTASVQSRGDSQEPLGADSQVEAASADGEEGSQAEAASADGEEGSQGEAASASTDRDAEPERKSQPSSASSRSSSSSSSTSSSSSSSTASCDVVEGELGEGQARAICDVMVF